MCCCVYTLLSVHTTYGRQIHISHYKVTVMEFQITPQHIYATASGTHTSVSEVRVEETRQTKAILESISAERFILSKMRFSLPGV